MPPISDDDYDEMERLMDEVDKEEIIEDVDTLNLLMFYNHDLSFYTHINLVMAVLSYYPEQALQCVTTLFYRGSFVVKTVAESQHKELKTYKYELKLGNIKSLIVPGNVYN